MLSRNVTCTRRCIRYMATFAQDRKRFYKDVTVHQTENGYQVKLDDKYNIRTPLRNVLVVPTEKLANAVALEWDLQKKNIISALMPLNYLCFKAIDQPIPKNELIEHMLEFLVTDTVCYRAGVEDDKLHTLENSRWNPITDWFADKYHVHLALTTDIMLTPQSTQTINKMRTHLNAQHEWTIPAYQSATHSLKSFVISMALLDGGLSADEAIACAYLETDFQIDSWGEVEWQHTLERARMSTDVAAAVLMVQEMRTLKRKEDNKKEEM